MVGVLACPNIYCVSRTYSKPQPVIQVNVQTSLYLTHLKAGCRSLHCPNTSLVSPGLTPNLSLSRYSKHFKTCHLLQPIDKSLSTNDLTVNMPQSETKHTSSESRILKLFDALDFTSTMYQPSDHFRTLAQAQHRSRENQGAHSTNDLSFTLDGVLSTLQQGSAENGVGSSVELRYHVEKAPCTDLRSDQTLLQNSYRTTQADAYVNHAHQTQSQSVNSQT